jgi:membrane dipeptidase
MNIIDMHCDTLMAALLRHGPGTDMNRLPGTMVDLERMRKGGVLAQFFAIYMVPESDFQTQFHMDPIPEDDYIEGCYEIFLKTLALHSDEIAQAGNAEDILANEKAGRMSAVLTMEDGVAVHGDMDKLKHFYDMGVRALALTWNFKNCFGSPNSDDPAVMQEGLTDFGKEAVAYMQELGMLVDVSHLSDGGFYDVAGICKKPFIATHSNCRALSPHRRNLTDDMLRILAEKGGVAGINFAPGFLNEDVTNRSSTIERMVAMIEHMKKIGGIDMIAIGSDLDGIGGQLEIGSSDQLPLLVQALEKRRFSGDEIDKITHKNVLRVMKECL